MEISHLPNHCMPILFSTYSILMSKYGLNTLEGISDNSNPTPSKALSSPCAGKFNRILQYNVQKLPRAIESSIYFLALPPLLVISFSSICLSPPSIPSPDS